MGVLIKRLCTPGLQDLGLLIIAASCLLLQLEGFADDPGVGWHLLTGDYILDSGTIPANDPFLYHPTPRAWVVDQWLGSTLLSALYRIGDWPGLYAALTLFFLFVFGGVLFGGLSSITGRSLGTSCAVLLAAKIAQIHFLIRPVIFGFFFFALVFLWLLKICRSLREEQELPGVSSFAGLFLLFFLWANFHGSFTLGLLLCGAASVSAWFQSAKTLRTRAFMRLVALTCGCFAATFITPSGVALYQKIFSLSTNSYFMSYHEEWLPPSLFSYEGQLFLLLLILPAFGILWSQQRAKKLTYFEVLSFFGLALLGFRAVRILPFFAIAATPVLAECLSLPFSSYIQNRFSVMTRFGKLLGRIERREGETSRGVLLLIVCSMLLAPVVAGKISYVPFYKGSYGPSESKFPVAATLFLYREALLDDSKAIVCAPPEWGGYISRYGHGELLPLMDDRNLLIGEKEYREFYAAFQSPGQWTEYTQARGARYLLFPGTSKFAGRLSRREQEALIYSDKVAIILDLRRLDSDVGGVEL